MRREVGPNGFHYQLYFGQIGRAERDIEKDVRGWLGGVSSTHFRPMRRPGRSNSRSLPTRVGLEDGLLALGATRLDDGCGS